MDRKSVVDASLAVLRERGLDGLTVRRIAQRLRVKNPALYWHFENKQQIVDAMAERMLETAAVGPGTPERWESWLTKAAKAFRAALLSQRDGARIVASADLSKSPMTESHNTALALLSAAGFKRRDAFVGVLAVFDYTLGATFEEQEDPIRDQSSDRTFAAGLQLIIDGLKTRLRHGKTRQPSSSVNTAGARPAGGMRSTRRTP